MFEWCKKFKVGWDLKDDRRPERQVIRSDRWLSTEVIAVEVSLDSARQIERS